MSNLLLVAAISSIAAAVFIATRSAFSTIRPASAPLHDAAARPRSRSLFANMLMALLRGLAPLTRRAASQTFRSEAPASIARAGLEDWLRVDELIAAKVITALLVPLVFAIALPAMTNVVTVIAIGAIGYLVPDYVVSSRRQSRERQIVRALPGSVDVLSLSVEAGLEFVIALQRLVQRASPSPLRDELATVLNDIRLGATRSEAFKSFASRVEVAEVSSFVSVLVQADILGASIGPVLKSQAAHIRSERFQRAEKEGARATQKILFPMVLFIFPAVLLVILAPVALSFIYGGLAE